MISEVEWIGLISGKCEFHSRDNFSSEIEELAKGAKGASRGLIFRSDAHLSKICSAEQQLLSKWVLIFGQPEICTIFSTSLSFSLQHTAFVSLPCVIYKFILSLSCEMIVLN